jgi:hypothetical protein
VAKEKELDYTKQESATIYAKGLAEFTCVLLAITQMTFEIS